MTLPDQGDKVITVEVFDKDKLGKDKSLGLLTFDIAQETTYATILYLCLRESHTISNRNIKK